MQTNTPPPTTQFDWHLYADATSAGLSLLIPIPLLDVAFESFSRRRMARCPNLPEVSEPPGG